MDLERWAVVLHIKLKQYNLNYKAKDGEEYDSSFNWYTSDISTLRTNIS